MKTIYVAGAYSADNVIQVFENMRLGINTSARLMAMGYAPFSPWLDYQFILNRPDNKVFEVKDFYEYSIAWLKKSDIMFVLPNYKTSKGTLAEIEIAKEMLIPIYYNFEDLENEVICIK